VAAWRQVHLRRVHPSTTRLEWWLHWPSARVDLVVRHGKMGLLHAVPTWPAIASHAHAATTCTKRKQLRLCAHVDVRGTARAVRADTMHLVRAAAKLRMATMHSARASTRAGTIESRLELVDGHSDELTRIMRRTSTKVRETSGHALCVTGLVWRGSTTIHVRLHMHRSRTTTLSQRRGRLHLRRNELLQSPGSRRKSLAVHGAHILVLVVVVISAWWHRDVMVM
jgi:hypothetical protein